MGIDVKSRRGLLEFLRDGFFGKPEERHSVNDYFQWVKIAGQQFGLWGTPNLTLGQKQEEIDPTFDGFAAQLFRANPIIYGCAERRRAVFSEATLKWRNKEDGHLFGTEALGLLEEPWSNGSTQALLSRMEQDVFLAGNWFGVRSEGEVLRLRPDWVDIIVRGGGYGDPKATPIAYFYWPGGKGSSSKPIRYGADEVAHYAPVPDPLYMWRGISPLNSILKEARADQAGTEHKLQYLEGGGTPNMIITAEAKHKPEAFERWKEIFKQERSKEPYGPLFLGGGADAKVVGSDLRQVDFKAVQALGENRICVATGVPAIIVGVSEGLEAATYSNFGQARRAFVDGTVRSLWKGALAALETIVPGKPGGAELWHDEGRIAYLQDDEKDRAEVMKEKASAGKMLFEAGYQPDAIAAFLNSGDPALLEGNHTGMLPVQVQDENESMQNGNGGEPSPEPSPN